MGRRKPVPLFELMRQKDYESLQQRRPVNPAPSQQPVRPAPSAGTKPLPKRPTGEPQPTVRLVRSRPSEATTYPTTRADRPETSASPGGTLVDRIRELVGGVPLGMVGLGIAAAVILGVLLWSIAFQLGGKSREADLKPYTDASNPRSLGTNESRRVDASSGTGRSQPETGNAGASGQASGTGAREGSGPAVQPDPGRQATPPPAPVQPPSQATTGNPPSVPGEPSPRPQPTQASATAVNGHDVLVDTRELGKNYLIIQQQLSRDEAVRAAMFLTENGVPALALVDPKARRDNSSSWSIWSSAGFQGGSEFNQSLRARNDLQATVARLGKRWQREHKGSSSWEITFFAKRTD